MKKKDAAVSHQMTKGSTPGAVVGARDESDQISMMRPFHVLLVDDDSLVRDVIRRALETIEVSAFVAENGRVAQRRILSEDIDLVITDINMPEMNGVKLLRWLTRERPHIESIVMTGFEQDNTMVHELRRRVIGYLQKPFPLGLLLDKVKKSMARQARRVEEMSRESKRPALPVKMEDKPVEM